MIRDRIEALVRELRTPDDRSRTHIGHAAARVEIADRLTQIVAEDEGGWRPIETAPVDRPILWREHAGSRVSVIDIDDYGECYLTPGSLWHEIPESPPGARP